MAVAFLSAQRSKDPKKQVGACIVDANKVIVGIGYNGFPRGCPDDALPWAKLAAGGNVLETKMPYVVHAEANAILNKNASSLHGAHLYVTMYPCCECAKLIIQCGIRKVTYYEAKNTSQPTSGDKDALYVAAARMLQLSGVTVIQHLASQPLHLALFSGANNNAGCVRLAPSMQQQEGDATGMVVASTPRVSGSRKAALLAEASSPAPAPAEEEHLEPDGDGDTRAALAD
jgi:dCMP deaminase